MSKRDLLLKEWASQVICFLSIHRTNGKDQLYYRITVDHLKGLKGVGEVKALRWKWGLVRFLQEVWLLWKSCLGCCVCVCVCMWTYWESCRQFQQHFDLATWASRFSKFTTNVNKINILESHLQILDFFLLLLLADFRFYPQTHTALLTSLHKLKKVLSSSSEFCFLKSDAWNSTFWERWTFFF